MNATEAAQLLLAISAFDNREVNRPAAEAWALVLHDVPLGDALGFLPGYYREHTGLGLEKLMPNHIVVGVRELQAARITRAWGDAFEAALLAGEDREAARVAAKEAQEQAEQHSLLGAAYRAEQARQRRAIEQW